MIKLGMSNVAIFPSSIQYLNVTVEQRTVFKIIFKCLQGTQEMPTCKYLDFLKPFQLNLLENPGLCAESGAGSVLAPCWAGVRESPSPREGEGGRGQLVSM